MPINSPLTRSAGFLTLIILIFSTSRLDYAQQQMSGDPLLEKTPTEAKEPRAKKKRFVPAGNLREALFMAAREDADREKYLRQAKELLDEPNASVGAIDEQGRTALHWAVLGAIDADSKLRAVYGDVTELLIAGGADINAADVYGNTPLDYQENSGAEEMRELLLENGARGGNEQSARLGALVGQLRQAADAGDLEAVRRELASDLPLRR